MDLSHIYLAVQFMFSEKDKKIKTTKFFMLATATIDVKNV